MSGAAFGLLSLALHLWFFFQDYLLSGNYGPGIQLAVSRTHNPERPLRPSCFVRKRAADPVPTIRLVPIFHVVAFC